MAAYPERVEGVLQRLSIAPYIAFVEPSCWLGRRIVRVADSFNLAQQPLFQRITMAYQSPPFKRGALCQYAGRVCYGQDIECPRNDLTDEAHPTRRGLAHLIHNS